MAGKQDNLPKEVSDVSGSRASAVPLLGDGFSEGANTVPSPVNNIKSQQPVSEDTEVDVKTGRRRFWGLGKKREDEKTKKKRETAIPPSPSQREPPSAAPRPTSPMQPPAPGHTSASSHPTSHPYGIPSSPSRNLHSSSPHMSSPASSQIFERNVQEDVLHTSGSPAIPAHITTENHIPPVLDSASAAITDDHLDPDSVEIVMHSVHQPAAVTVTGAIASEATGRLSQDDSTAHPENDDAASTYGALDATDVRRLSFISFADVVLAEHADHGGSKDPSYLSGTTSISPLATSKRSPSPGRSPESSQGLGGSPVLSGSTSLKGQEQYFGPSIRSPGNPFVSHSPPAGGELTIETMRQALRKTGSGDLSSVRSQPMSAVEGDDGTVEHPFK